MGTVIVPFMKLDSDEDYEWLVEIAEEIIDFWAENALEHERCGEMIERIGLVNFLEGIGVDVDPNMVSSSARELLRPHGRLGRRSGPSGSSARREAKARELIPITLRGAKRLRPGKPWLKHVSISCRT